MVDILFYLNWTMNSFYRKPKIFQWFIAILLLAIALVPIIAIVEIGNGLLFLPLLLVFAPIIQFSLSPLMTLFGAYHYLSPMMIVYNPNEKKYDLHSGTSFDYLLVMKNVPKGKATEKKLLEYFCEGFLEIINRIENGKLTKEIKITGTSYFMSLRTAERFGFESGKQNWFLTLNLYLNYIDLLWMYSRSKGKLAFPKLGNAKSIETTGEKLVANKEYILKMKEYLGK